MNHIRARASLGVSLDPLSCACLVSPAMNREHSGKRMAIFNHGCMCSGNRGSLTPGGNMFILHHRQIRLLRTAAAMGKFWFFARPAAAEIGCGGGLELGVVADY